MKKICVLAVAIAGLSGCVVYPDDYQDVYYADQTYITTPYAGQTTYIVQESSPNVVYVEQPTYVYSRYSYYEPRRIDHTPPHLHRRPEAPKHHAEPKPQHQHHAEPKPQHQSQPKPHNGKHHKKR